MTIDQNRFKTCSACGGRVHKSQFYKDSRHKDGLMACCKKCQIDRSTQSRMIATPAFDERFTAAYWHNQMRSVRPEYRCWVAHLIWWFYSEAVAGIEWHQFRDHYGGNRDPGPELKRAEMLRQCRVIGFDPTAAPPRTRIRSRGAYRSRQRQGGARVGSSDR